MKHDRERSKADVNSDSVSRRPGSSDSEFGNEKGRRSSNDLGNSSRSRRPGSDIERDDWSSDTSSDRTDVERDIDRSSDRGV